MKIDEIRIKSFRAAGVDLSTHELVILLIFVFLLLATATTTGAYYLVGPISVAELLHP